MSIKIVSGNSNKRLSLTGMTMSSLVDEASSISGLAPDNIQLFTNFPPQQIIADSATDALQVIQSGSVVTIRDGKPPSLIIGPKVESAPHLSTSLQSDLESNHSGVDLNGPSNSNLMNLLLEIGYNRTVAEQAISVSGDSEENFELALEVCLQIANEDLAPVGTSIKMHRRVINADNSCLFNAIGYLVLGEKNSSGRLRGIIGEVVLSDPEQFSEAFLGKAPSDYATWINDSEKWGGEIEMSILANYFSIDITAMDIQTLNSYRYGPTDKPRVFLLYDGIHYDALVRVQLGREDREIDDVKIFPFDDPTADTDAKVLASDFQSMKRFVDLAGCSLRCLVCGIGLKGQKEAQEHAKATGHVNLAQV